jgi:hypothetical protein
MQLTCQRSWFTPVQNKNTGNQLDGKIRAVTVVAAWAALTGVKYVFPVHTARRLVDFSLYFNEMEIFWGV